jgi:hypothetical protein
MSKFLEDRVNLMNLFDDDRIRSDAFLIMMNIELQLNQNPTKTLDPIIYDRDYP